MAVTVVAVTPVYTLAGHRGDCLKVLIAFFQGLLTGRCTCGADR